MTGTIRGFGERAKYFIDRGGLHGKMQVTKAEYDEAFPDQPIGDGSGLLGWKPLVSEALCVHPDQRKEATEDAHKKGVPTHFDAEGRPVFTSRSHKKEYCEKYGFFDRAGGYGDARRGAPR